MGTASGSQASRMQSINQSKIKVEVAKPVKLLLLNFSPGSKLGDNLQEILAAPQLKPEVEYKSVLPQEPSARSEIIDVVSNFGPSLIFLVLSQERLKEPEGLLQSLKPLLIPIIVVIEAAEPRELIEMLKQGVSDFITPPLKSFDILPRIWRLLRFTTRDRAFLEKVKGKLGLQHIVGESRAFLSALKSVPLVANCDVCVLISGETGTGKELVARAIHYLGPRADKPFIPINCGAIPPDLIENELFGHERGAFTSASNTHKGLIREADGGTLFLDEIDSLPSLAQVKFLRFLQEKEYRSLGSTKTLRANVRVMAASNVDFEKAVREGKLRSDLYYRLNVIPIDLPALRDRREDIPLLAYHFLAKYAGRFNKPLIGFSPHVMQMFLLYDWPGNVRELEHVIERAIVLADNQIIGKNHIFLPNGNEPTSEASFQELKGIVVSEFERAYIKSLLRAHDGNINKAARAAQKNRRAFWQLMRKHNIKAKEFKSEAG